MPIAKVHFPEDIKNPDDLANQLPSAHAAVLRKALKNPTERKYLSEIAVMPKAGRHVFHLRYEHPNVAYLGHMGALNDHHGIHVRAMLSDKVADGYWPFVAPMSTGSSTYQFGKELQETPPEQFAKLVRDYRRGEAGSSLLGDMLTEVVPNSRAHLLSTEYRTAPDRVKATVYKLNPHMAPLGGRIWHTFEGDRNSLYAAHDGKMHVLTWRGEIPTQHGVSGTGYSAASQLNGHYHQRMLQARDLLMSHLDTYPEQHAIDVAKGRFKHDEAHDLYRSYMEAKREYDERMSEYYERLRPTQLARPSLTPAPEEMTPAARAAAAILKLGSIPDSLMKDTPAPMKPMGPLQPPEEAIKRPPYKPDRGFLARIVKTLKASNKARYNKAPLLSDDTVEKIRQLHEAGHAPLGIALHLGDSTGSLIPVHAIERVVKHKSQKYSNERQEFAAHLAARGHTPLAIKLALADRFGDKLPVKLARDTTGFESGWVEPDGTYHENERDGSGHPATARRLFPNAGGKAQDEAFESGYGHVGYMGSDIHLYTRKPPTADQIRSIRRLAKTHGFDSLHIEHDGGSKAYRV